MEVTDHAVIRYLERHHENLLKDIQDTIKVMISKGRVVLPKFSVKKYRDNGYTKHRYVKYNKMVFVVGMDGVVVTTLEWKGTQFKYTK